MSCENSFDQCRKFEEEHMGTALAVLKKAGYQAVPLFGENPLALYAQKTLHIDLALFDGKAMHMCEVKTEASGESGNFFLEELSNSVPGHETPGWMKNSKADLLLYHFVNTGFIYLLDFKKLQAWFWDEKNLKLFSRKEQKKHAQANVTVGRLVPIRKVREAGLMVRLFQKSPGGDNWIVAA